MTSLQVLLIESEPGAARHEPEVLEAAGHQVHRCFDPRGEAFPCRAIGSSDGCPLDHGIDVVLLVRPRVRLRPTTFEQGVTCAVRRSIPIVEVGPTVLDPFEDVVTTRVTGDVADACEAAVALNDDTR